MLKSCAFVLLATGISAAALAQSSSPVTPSPAAPNSRVISQTSGAEAAAKEAPRAETPQHRHAKKHKRQSRRPIKNVKAPLAK